MDTDTLKVGDWLIYRGDRWARAQITKVTKTQLVCGRTRIAKRDLCEIGTRRDHWHARYWEIETPELRSAFAERIQRNRIISKLRN